MTRHFRLADPALRLWALFLAAGAMLALAARRWPRRAGWLGPRLFVALALLPALILAGPGIYAEAWLLLALGVASLVAPVLERQQDRWRRRLARTAPDPGGAGAAPGRLAVRPRPARRSARGGPPPPPAGAPNVLVIVLDTVLRRPREPLRWLSPAHDQPNLQRLAGRRGFASTAPSRAAAALDARLACEHVFTGQWPHEYGRRVDDRVRCGGTSRRLAEHLGSLGYATAGFVGNTFYASYDTSLDRGFAHYEDYVLDGLNATRTAKALDDLFKFIGELGRMWHISGRAYQVDLTRGERKDARAVNREFLEWQARRRALATASSSPS